MDVGLGEMGVLVIHNVLLSGKWEWLAGPECAGTGAGECRLLSKDPRIPDTLRKSMGDIRQVKKKCPRRAMRCRMD